MKSPPALTRSTNGFSISSATTIASGTEANAAATRHQPHREGPHDERDGNGDDAQWDPRGEEWLPGRGTARMAVDGVLDLHLDPERGLVPVHEDPASRNDQGEACDDTPRSGPQLGCNEGGSGSDPARACGAGFH